VLKRPRSRTHCTQPDHDEPRIECGAPLPCPYHTSIVDVSGRPATVTTPATVIRDPIAAVRLQQIALALEDLGELVAARPAKVARPRRRRSRRPAR